jgi:hypothetical protein
MTPQDLIAPEAGGIGIRAEQSGAEANSHHADRIPKLYPQQKNEFFTKVKSWQKCILEEMYRKHFLDVPLALPPSQPPDDIPCEADPKRAPVNLVFSRPPDARDFERHAPQRGCKFLYPELTVRSELCHVPPARQAALAGRNILL